MLEWLCFYKDKWDIAEIIESFEKLYINIKLSILKLNNYIKNDHSEAVKILGSDFKFQFVHRYIDSEKSFKIVMENAHIYSKYANTRLADDESTALMVKQALESQYTTAEI